MNRNTSITITNSMRICIDTYNGGEISGRLYNIFLKNAFEFNSTIMLLKAMTELYDLCGQPQPTMLQRFFDKAPDTLLDNLLNTDAGAFEAVSSPENSIEAQGKTATFKVVVHFRRYASWQGTVVWIEEDREENFRSVIELLLIIDSALS